MKISLNDLRIDLEDHKKRLKELSNKGIVSCKEVSFRIFGFSLATLNFLVNIALILFYSLILKYEK